MDLLEMLCLFLQEAFECGLRAFQVVAFYGRNGPSQNGFCATGVPLR